MFLCLNFQIEDFYILKYSLDAKIWDVIVYGSLQTEDFNILGSCPWTSKAAICMFLNPKTSKSNMFWVISLNAKSFYLKIFGIENLQIEDFKS